MEQDTEVRLLCANLTAMLNAYERQRPGTDANDVISALAWMLCEVSCLNNVPRDMFQQHVMTIFDTTLLCMHETRDD
jgi:hypothetical protein